MLALNPISFITRTFELISKNGLLNTNPLTTQTVVLTLDRSNNDSDIFDRKIERPEGQVPHANLRRLYEGCKSSRDFENLMKRQGVPDRDLNYLKRITGAEYTTFLNRVCELAIGLEKLSPGASLHIKNWLSGVKSLDETNERIRLLQIYSERLAIHGETDIGDALSSFNSLKICPTHTLIDKLLRLHYYSGITRIGRFADSRDPNRQKKLESIINHFIDNFEGKGYKEDSKIAVAYVTGVTQGFEEPPSSDMFANPQGASKVIESLVKEKYKILVFEVDKPTTQILKGAEHASIAAGGRPIDLIVPAGHGTPISTNFGLTTVPRAFTIPDKEYMKEVRKRNENYLRNIEEEIRRGTRKPLKWEIENIANGKVEKEDDVLLDITDGDEMEELKKYLSPDAITVFASCNVARGNDRRFSLAGAIHHYTGMTVFGCTQPIDNIDLKFKNRRVVEVLYTNRGRILECTRFPSR